MATAKQVDFLLSGSRKSDGSVNAGGYVWTYSKGTTTPLATYTDPNKVTTSSNPVTLDSAGKAMIYGSGEYRFDIYDTNNVLIETRDGLQYFSETTILLDSGTVSAPSLSFRSESGTNTGLYWISEGNLGITVNGVLIMTINSSGITLQGSINYS